MGRIQITKIFHFEMAHALEGYDGLCQNIHGHSYTLRVTVTGTPIEDSKSSKNGMIIDFSDLKQIVKDSITNKYDHALVLNSKTDIAVINTLRNHYNKIVIVDYQPTSEQLLMDFADILQNVLPQNAILHSLRLNETETSYAEWFNNFS
jgi:6-pyruvoyltetrahydropterin/6-carboxytetrahydropterin synthase